MGLEYNSTKLLLYSKKRGVDLEKTITIGRQSIHLSRKQLNTILKFFNYENLDVDLLLTKSNGYIDYFLKTLGAEITDSLDISEYENPSIIHDMNLPISEEIKGKYTTVIDGGSLEHIFNIPIAIKNCMELLQEGGHYIGIIPANNFFGHGFYQFSPEFFYAVFSKENGFKIVNIIFYNNKPASKWYAVANPFEVKSRIILRNNQESYLFVLAKKISTENIFKHHPQQSDYLEDKWNIKEYDRVEKSKQNKYIRKSIIPFSDILLKKFNPLLNSLISMIRPIGNAENRFFKEINSI